MTAGRTWFGNRYYAEKVSEVNSVFEPSEFGRRRFGATKRGFYFPLWYPTLVFALAAVAAIRIGRQVTLRSALVGMSVAALLAMVVAL